MDKVKINIKLIVLILIIVGGISMLLFNILKQNHKIVIVEKESFFSDYSIDNDKVYIKCELAIKNLTELQKVEFYAYFPEDCKLGLLKSAQLKGYKEDKETSLFYFQKGQERAVVVFIGEFGGINLKSGRNLPEIKMKILVD